MKHFFQKFQNKNRNKINKTDESSTIYNDDSYNEIQIISNSNFQNQI